MTDSNFEKRERSAPHVRRSSTPPPMTSKEFKAWQGTRTNPETAELLFCSLRLVEAMRQGTRPVSDRTRRMIEREAEP